MPFVEKAYRVKPGAKNRALAGLSMGGLHTLYTGVKNTNLFSALGVFSSGWIQPVQAEVADAQYALMKEQATAINNNLSQFWIAMGGKEDIAYKNCKMMMDTLKSLSIRHTYTEYPGGHTWPVWRINLYNFAPLLFKK
jgi:enterochelin esterase-like enzyme